MIVIVDTGGANLASIQNSLSRLGCPSRVSKDQEIIRQASHVILPGVGAAKDAMDRLRDSCLAEVLQNLTQPVLGICLGLQLLFDYSEEGDTSCLGIIPGTVRKIPAGPGITVPHMGWNTLKILENHDKVFHPKFDGQHVYFVHSFAVGIGPHTIAESHHGISFSAAVKFRNYYGMQFHPEKSAKIGSDILKGFLKL